MSNYIEFQGSEEFEHHTCTGRREGEWLIFTCPHCEYERRFNRTTGEVKLKQGAPTALHRGKFKPVGVNLTRTDLN